MDFTKLLNKKSTLNNIDTTTLSNDINLTDINFNDIDNLNDKNIDNVNLDDLIMQGKKYINLLTDEHHYFINYNNCINNGNKILQIHYNINNQEIKNKIKLAFTKYKIGKNYHYEINSNVIHIMDNKNNQILDKLELPYAVDLENLLHKEENNLNNLYIQTKNTYNLLTSELQDNEESITEFKNLKQKLELKINNYYTLQYVLNNLLKRNNNNKHYILHNVIEAYNSTNENRKFLLQLKNSDINSKSLEYLLFMETELLNKYNDILQNLKNVNLDNKLNNDIKDDIKNYLIIKNNLHKNINKLTNIKSKIKRSTIYINQSDIKNINNNILTYYIKNNINKV